MRIMNEQIALSANKNGFMNLFLPLLSYFLSTLKNDSSRNFELLDNDYFLSPSVSNQWSSKENSQVNQYDQKDEPRRCLDVFRLSDSNKMVQTTTIVR